MDCARNIHVWRVFCSLCLTLVAATWTLWMSSLWSVIVFPAVVVIVAIVVVIFALVGVCNSYDLENMQAPPETFTFQTITKEGWGFTYNAKTHELIVSDGSEYLLFWDPANFTEIRRVKVQRINKNLPSKNINELEFWRDRCVPKNQMRPPQLVSQLYPLFCLIFYLYLRARTQCDCQCMVQRHHFGY